MLASPNAVFIASVSQESFRCVEVPCALIYVISSGFTFASSIAIFIALAPPSPPGAGDVMWYASDVAPYPTISAYIFLFLNFACSNSSNITIPAPSPITNPLLSLSNGILALFLSVACESAFILVNPAIPIGVIAASVPPDITISWYPFFIILKLSPIQCVPDAQAVTIEIDSPFAPNSIATFPAAILAIFIGINIGLTLSGPFSWIFVISFSIVSNPPIPEPNITPTLSIFSFSLSNLLSSQASFAAIIAN